MSTLIYELRLSKTSSRPKSRLEPQKISENQRNAIFGCQNIFDGQSYPAFNLFIFYLRPYFEFQTLNILCLIGKPQQIIQNLLCAFGLEKASNGHQGSNFSSYSDDLSDISQMFVSIASTSMLVAVVRNNLEKLVTDLNDLFLILLLGTNIPKKS